MAKGNKTNWLNEIEDNTVFMLNGEVLFSRIVNKIKGEEREKFNEGKKYKIDKDYFTLTLKNVDKATTSNKCVADSKKAIEEYVKSKLYEDNKGHENCFSINSKSTKEHIPTYLNVGKNKFQPTELEHELAEGVKVVLMLRVYETEQDNGLALDCVLINDEIRYFEPTNFEDNFTDFGFNLI